MRRRFTIVLAAAAAVGLAAPAHAELYGHDDPAQDPDDVSAVWCPAEFEGEGTCSVATPSVASGDILRTNVRYESNRVLFRIRERSIDRIGQRAHNVVVVTNEGVRRRVRITAAPGSLQPTSLVMRKPDGTRVACGLWAGNDPATDLFTLVVPRHCLSYPRWVQVSVATEGRWITCPDEFAGDLADMCRTEDGRRILGSDSYTTDQAFPWRYSSGTGWTALSPRIYRG